MAKQNKKDTPTPEGINFMDLIRKIGNDTVASIRKDIAEGKLPAGKKKGVKEEEGLGFSRLDWPSPQQSQFSTLPAQELRW